MKRKSLWVLTTTVVLSLVALLIYGCNASPDRTSESPDNRSLVYGLIQSDIPFQYPVLSEGEKPDVNPGEELWVITKPNSVLSPGTQPAQAQQGQQTPQPTDDQSPTTGTLAIQKDQQFIPIPLKHTDVKARISGYIASVAVTQQFHNPYPEKIEAVYVFPLPENAGINEFIMTIGTRKIRGIIREREEATKIYNQAKQQGYVASLMTQERPNIFTQRVANIEPGKQIDIEIRYFHTLTYQDGGYEWVFPMVVGPRYNPAGSTDGVGAVGTSAVGQSGQKTEVAYLKPTQRSGHDISLEVDLNAGVTLEALSSVNHVIRQQNRGPGQVVVQLDASDTIPNKDFVLRYRVAGAVVKTALMVTADPAGTGGYFTLMLVPPAELKNLPRRAVEMVFVVDTSGSMSGEPLSQAKRAATVALGKMLPTDTFQIVQFAGSASQMAESPLNVTPASRKTGEQYLANLNEGGGTEMLQGINKALDFPHDENRTRVVAFMTDGYIGNETQILRALYAKLADSKVFSFGVGSSTNRYLLDNMARIGNGTTAYLPLNTNPEPVMDAYFERISHPALSNIALAFDGMKVTDIYPRQVPDLFVGQPVIITGRYTGTPQAGSVTITGRAGQEKLTTRMPVTAENTQANPGIRTVWARMKIADLSDTALRDNVDVTKDIRATALEYGLMSAYTAFVAVDSQTKTTGDHGTTIAVPVPMPDGVRYDTTVNEGTKPQP